MGYTPEEVGRMSWWQFFAALDGFLISKGVEQRPDPMSLDEIDEILATRKL